MRKMRRAMWCSFVAAVFLTVCGVSMAAEQTVTLSWSLDNLEEDLQGWRIYLAPAEAGPWEQIGGDVLYLRDNPAGPYQLAHVLNPPDGEETTYWFRATAFDTSYNESAPSDVLPVRFDFKPPAAPAGFKVEIKVIPK